MKSLISVPTMVEAPFIIVKIGKYTFGQVSKLSRGDLPVAVEFPNFVKQLQVEKINGEVNTYTITMSYQISTGDDPNFIDRVLSTVSDTRTLTISYGDWCSPSHIYKDEEALITNVKSNVNFAQSNIQYTITCVSKCMSLLSVNYPHPARKTKPSTVIMELLRNPVYGITDAFSGMRNIGKVLSSGIIATNDAVVNIEAKPQINTWDYLNYLVSCMIPYASTTNSVTDVAFKLAVHDDNSNKMNGSYFEVVELSKYNAETDDAYQIDVGYPSDNYITNFQLTNDEQWTILYNLSQAGPTQYIYRIDKLGNVIQTPSNSLTRSGNQLAPRADSTAWWSEVTEFPVTATLTLKGLVRPTLLMSYVKLNVVFYGQRHISSGTYIITKEIDNINENGYKTTLSLTRVKGDTASMIKGIPVN